MGFQRRWGFGSITLLKNSCGMHILQNISARSSLLIRKYPWDDLVAMAMPFLEGGLYRTFDPNEASLYNPPPW